MIDEDPRRLQDVDRMLCSNRVALDWLGTNQAGTAKSLGVIEAFVDLWLLWQLWWSSVLFWGDYQW